MALTEARRNEIAYLVLVERAKKKGIHNLKPNEFRRDLANQAKEVGISTEEAMEFVKGIYIPLVEALFAKKADDGHNFKDGVES